MVQCLLELSPCVSSMFVCSSGDLVVHLLQVGSLDLRSSRALIFFFCSVYPLSPYYIGPSLLYLS